MNALLLALLLTQPVPQPVQGPNGPINRITGSVTQNGMTLTVTGGGGGSPGGVSGNLQINNGAGGFGAYAGSACTGANLVQSLSANGAATCWQLRLNQLANPTGDTTFTYPSGTKMLWTFTGSTDEAFTIHGDGAFTGTGDLVHIHKSGTGAAVGADVLHVEADADTNINGIRVTMPSTTSPAITTNGVVTASRFYVGTGADEHFRLLAPSLIYTPSTLEGLNVMSATGVFLGDSATAVLKGQAASGGVATAVDSNANYTAGKLLSIRNNNVEKASVDFSGAITAPSFIGPLTGNASTATALAADPTACGAGSYVTDVAANGSLTCSVPPGTYTLPAASTTLGGVKMAAACGAGNHVSSIGAGGELTCTADSGSGGGAPTTSQYWIGAADAALTNAKNLGALGTGLVLNTGGTPSIKAANTCTNQFARSDNASGVWTCASITAADLPVVTVADGGSGLSTVATNQIYVATGTDTFTAKTLPSCSNATTSKLLYDNATQTFSCGTDQGGGGGLSGTLLKVTGADYTNSTTTPSNIFTFTVPAAGEYGFTCVINAQGTTTSLPRYNVNGPTSTNVSFMTERSTTTSAQTLLTLQAFSAAAQTAACTTGCNATNLITRITGSFTASASGTLAFMASSSTAAQTVTVRRGSYCLVF